MMDRHPLRFEGLTAARVNPGAYKMTITVQIYGPAALKASLPPQLPRVTSLVPGFQTAGG